MPDTTNAALLKVIESSNARVEKMFEKSNEIMSDVAGGLRDLTTFVKQSQRIGGSSTNNGNTGFISIISIVLVLMASMGAIGMVLIDNQGTSISAIVSLMEEDNLRELVDAAGTATTNTTIREQAIKSEAQFKCQDKTAALEHMLLRCEMRSPPSESSG